MKILNTIFNVFCFICFAGVIGAGLVAWLGVACFVAKDKPFHIEQDFRSLEYIVQPPKEQCRSATTTPPSYTAEEDWYKGHRFFWIIDSSNPSNIELVHSSNCPCSIKLPKRNH